LIHHYTKEEKLCSALWNELHSAYTDSSRHYHNLTHLENLYAQLLPVKNEIKNRDAVLFALFIMMRCTTHSNKTTRKRVQNSQARTCN
jgi:predicted metal-dependent HD superfamily phosphohydrolase